MFADGVLENYDDGMSADQIDKDLVWTWVDLELNHFWCSHFFLSWNSRGCGAAMDGSNY